MARLVTLKNLSSLAISQSELDAIAAALQIQVDRDLYPIWGRRAQVVALGADEAEPEVAWPIRILDDSEYGLGVHLDQNNRPYAEVEATGEWTVTASHELLEMLVDPFGQTVAMGPCIDPSQEPHYVRYLVEIADPCEVFAYTINGVPVSDFVTEDYYNEFAGPGASFDLLGRLGRPFEVPEGCYISWVDDDGFWHQKTPDGLFTRSRGKVDSRKTLRQDRDGAFGGEADAERHRLAAIRRRFRR